MLFIFVQNKYFRHIPDFDPSVFKNMSGGYSIFPFMSNYSIFTYNVALNRARLFALQVKALARHLQCSHRNDCMTKINLEPANSQLQGPIENSGPKRPLFRTE